FRECLGGWEGSVLDVFRCEYEWDNLTVKMYARRGADNGVRIAYGKNLTDFVQEQNNENVYDGVYGYAVVDEVTYEASNYFNIQHSIGEFRPVYDGNVIDLGGRPLEIIHVPGHTPGSIAVLDINARALFSGDTVQDGNVYLFGIEREFRAYAYSLERLEQIKDRYDVIYPCHGNIPLGADHVPRLLECAREVINGRKKPVTEIVWEQEISKYEFDCGTFLCEKAEHY
ncbi:MAG: phage tail protein, partial [Lachnospiraceae bacterium]|nr:phage tail protein [Lachnospiraceae bacterium]